MRALALALAMLVAAPAVAGAETWRGKTEQGRAVAGTRGAIPGFTKNDAAPTLPS